MTIEYFTKDVYGSKRMYFVNENHRISFYGLTRRITFDDVDKRHLINFFGTEIIFKEVLAPPTLNLEKKKYTLA